MPQYVTSGREHLVFLGQKGDRKSVIDGRILIALGGLTGCSSNSAGDLGKGSLVSEKTIEQVLEDRTDQWMAIPGVEGTAIGIFGNEPCIMILSSVAPQQLGSKIPETLNGYNIVIQQTGTFTPLDSQ